MREFDKPASRTKCALLRQEIRCPPDEVTFAEDAEEVLPSCSAG
jgi:hypothetical protein